MDPKTLSNLDPKLRETYERVMGSTGPTAEPSSQPGATTSPATGTTTSTFPETAAPTAPPIPTPISTPVMDPSLSSPTPVGNSPFQTPVIPMNEPAPLPSPASVNQNIDSAPASPLIRILYIGGAIVFFLVYTFFWMKVFNLQMPF